MRKVILYIAQSIDGMIADTDGGVDWLGGEKADFNGDYGYSRLMDEADTVLLGYTTYHQIVNQLSPDSWPYAGKRCFVLTHNPISTDDGSIIFTDEAPDELVTRLCKETGKAIWVCGGASVASQLVSADLIDEYQLCTMPMILGGGVRLFDTLPAVIPLHLENCSVQNGVVLSRYARK